jgi:hypothetical protein
VLFDVSDDMRCLLPDGARDFDFLEGHWVIRHRRLTQRLVGADTWEEFETPATMHPILGGLGNIDQCQVSGSQFFEGVSIRLYDKSARVWRIYWTDSTGARLFPPVEGSFVGAVGLFEGTDEHQGRPVRVVFRWNKSDVHHPVWEQAFSPDEGETWETNWRMHFRRPHDR